MLTFMHDRDRHRGADALHGRARLLLRARSIAGHRPSNNRLVRITGLRPSRSPVGPDARAPTMTPTLDMANGREGGGCDVPRVRQRRCGHADGTDVVAIEHLRETAEDGDTQLQRADALAFQCGFVGGGICASIGLPPCVPGVHHRCAYRSKQASEASRIVASEPSGRRADARRKQFALLHRHLCPIGESAREGIGAAEKLQGADWEALRYAVGAANRVARYHGEHRSEA